MAINYSTAKSIIRLYKTEHLRVRGSLHSVKGDLMEEQSTSSTRQLQTSSYRALSRSGPVKIEVLNNTSET